MKNATKIIIEELPIFKKYVELDENELNKEEKTLLKLITFFENTPENNFNLLDLYLNLSDEWLELSLKAIQTFFEKDTYLLSSNKNNHSIIANDYLNQKDFVDFLNEKGINFSEAKMSMYVKREVMPEPDLIISNKRFWLKETCEKYLQHLTVLKEF